MAITTRFAPSPTGPLHLGHAYSAMRAFDLLRDHDDQFLLRIEDIDQSRARPTWETQIFDDLSWLGLSWSIPVMRQSTRLSAYKEALKELWNIGLLYVCTCNRRDVHAAASAPQEGADPLVGPDGVVYPGTCRHKVPRSGPLPEGVTLRLDMATTLDRITPRSLTFDDARRGNVTIKPSSLIHEVGDVVVARRDMGTSYHLAVVLDDAEQHVTDVVRGEDLFDATAIHIVLQRLLNLPTPRYHHHRLIRDEAGKRLAKRDDARALSTYRDQGASPADIRRMLDLPTFSE